MTPLQAAKKHCANYDNGQCLGVDFDEDNDYSMYRFRNEGKCVFNQPVCQACSYFEEVVLPQVGKTVAEEYRLSLPAAVKTTVRPQRHKRMCKACRKVELPPRQRYCEPCLRIRQREAARLSMERKRKRS